MRTTSTLSVLFWIHRHRVDKNNLSTVNARITVSGKKVIMSLNQKVDVDLWDSTRQKVKGTGKTSKTINNYLDEVRSELVFCYRDLKLESRVITPQLIKARFLGEDKKIYSLKDVFRYHNEKLGVKLAPKTLCHYRTSQKYISAYIKSDYSKDDMYLQDLDYAFVIGFESFLRKYKPRHYQDKIGNNAVMKLCYFS